MMDTRASTQWNLSEMWCAGEYPIYLCHRDHGCRLPKRTTWKESAGPPGKHRAERLVRRAPLPAAPGAAPLAYLPPSVISGRLPQPGRPEGKADNWEAYDTICAHQHSRIVQTLRRGRNKSQHNAQSVIVFRL